MFVDKEENGTMSKEKTEPEVLEQEGRKKTATNKID